MIDVGEIIAGREARIRQLSAQGMTRNAIAKELGCDWSTVNRVVGGPRGHSKTREANQWRKDRVKAMRAEGKPIREICEAVGVADSAVYRILAGGRGVEPRQYRRVISKPVVRKQPKPPKRVAPLGILAATDSYLRGDGDALRDYLRRVGRDALQVVCGGN